MVIAPRTKQGKSEVHGKCAEIVIKLTKETDARLSLGTIVNRQFLAFAWPTVTSTPRKHHNHKIPREMDGCRKNCAETRSPTKDTCATRKLTNRCCVHVCANSALDVSL